METPGMILPKSVPGHIITLRVQSREDLILLLPGKRRLEHMIDGLQDVRFQVVVLGHDGYLMRSGEVEGLRRFG